MEVIGTSLFSPGTTNRLLVAISSLVVNLGARHLPSGLSPRLQALTMSMGMRMLVVCALFYLSTRDLMMSVALASVFFAVIGTLFNEDSRFSVFEKRPMTMPMSMPLPVHITREVYDRAVDTVLRFRSQMRKTATAPAAPAALSGGNVPGHP